MENQGDVILDRSNREISSISGNHLASKANADVKLVVISKSNCFYFPLGFSNFFINLEGIKFFKTKFKEVRKEDLKEFPNLRLIDFEGNEIEFLEANLFENNPKLRFIGVDNNKIAHIDAHIFDIFAKSDLDCLFLSNNTCKFEEDIMYDKPKVNQIIAKIQTGFCKDDWFYRSY